MLNDQPIFFDVMSENIVISELASNFSTLRKLAEKTAREKSKKKKRRFP